MGAWAPQTPPLDLLVVMLFVLNSWKRTPFVVLDITSPLTMFHANLMPAITESKLRFCSNNNILRCGLHRKAVLFVTANN